MKEFWDKRYSDERYAYGEGPNMFFKYCLENHSPGRILLPAEGEGRNAVYAAKKGWDVYAFDQSIEGKKKAGNLATRNDVSIHYEVANFLEYDFQEGFFDMVGMVYVHLSGQSKGEHLAAVDKSLREGGVIIFEAFSKSHLEFSSVNEKAGGPKDPAMLYSKEDLVLLFPKYNIILLEEKEVELNEGLYHVGRSSVIRYVGVK